MDAKALAESLGEGVELAGIAVIIIGAVVATVAFIREVVRRRGSDPYRTYRHTLAKAILLGLEFLVAGDIIGTVAVSPTFRSIGVLAGIVAIRTFLSVSLEMEIEGRWPWEGRRPATAHRTSGEA